MSHQIGKREGDKSHLSNDIMFPIPEFGRSAFMRLLLAWLQHLLIVLPAIATLYVSSIPSPGVYVGYILLALLILRLTVLAPATAYFLLPIQIIGYGWLCNVYGGLLFFLIYSGLVSAFLYFRKPVEIVVMVILSIVTLNSVVMDNGTLTLWVVNLVWLALTLLLTELYTVNRKQGRFERLYDSLLESHDLLEQERARTLEYARKVEDYAQVEERSRIATELHDDLGHRLIRVKMMTEAVLQLMEHDPLQAKHMLEQVRGQMEESMNNMRYTVRKLQPPDVQNVRRYALPRLIEDAGRDLQIAVSFEITGRPLPLYPSVEYVLYRNAQEAITNAVRHGSATAVEIELYFATDTVTMNITNNGKLPQDVSYGMGLRGMQERLTMLGGQLSVSVERGFVISTVVPYHEVHSTRAEGEKGID
jgi:two-component system NarL family sensor kinase